MSLTRSVAHNTIIHSIAKFITMILGVAVVALLTRHLGQSGYGQYTTVTAFLEMFAVFVDLGLYLVLIQMISQPGIDESKIVGNIFTLKFFSSLIFLSLAPLAAMFIPVYPLVVKIGIAVLALKYLFGSLIQILTGFFQQKMAMKKVAIAEIVSRVILLASVLLAVYFKQGLLFIFGVIVFSASVEFLMIYLFSLKYVKISFRLDWLVWKEILVKCWPVALSVALTLIYFKGDTVILSLSRPSDEVGVYGAAYRVLEVLVMFPPMFSGLVLSPLSFSWVNRDSERFKRILQKSFDFFGIIVIPMVIGALFLGKPLMTMIAGPEFAISGNVLKILIFATGMIFMGNTFCRAIIAIDRQKKLIPFYLLTAVVALAGYLVFIPRYSYYGAAGMTVVAESLMAVSAFILVRKETKISLSFKVFFKALAAGMAMAIFLYVFAGQNLFLMILSAAAVYFLVLYLIKGITKDVVLEIIRTK